MSEIKPVAWRSPVNGWISERPDPRGEWEAVYPASALAAKDAEIARLQDLVKRLADRLVTRGHSERSQEYCTDCALVAEARKEMP